MFMLMNIYVIILLIVDYEKCFFKCNVFVFIDENEFVFVDNKICIY